ncbi:uncharacterized protein B0I36DRAFT_428918 [Microdochium trichocladiopsis]|uniref:Uncharacterized protein n=1 Tax=Microdochium trichocladiopsis TaxID=1682393 RepID=A0A9P8Y9X1_9PEZI|nr:uncharacterized protein B0I36DRAFT_428918 [Microdochium trichocladiopsis]KAH7034598.1 hypothetical protein B0I36DRAFT_428918 [Microdochium trichocladiopsis]
MAHGHSGLELEPMQVSWCGQHSAVTVAPMSNIHGRAPALGFALQLCMSGLASFRLLEQRREVVATPDAPREDSRMKQLASCLPSDYLPHDCVRTLTIPAPSSCTSHCITTPHLDCGHRKMSAKFETAGPSGVTRGGGEKASTAHHSQGTTSSGLSTTKVFIRDDGDAYLLIQELKDGKRPRAAEQVLHLIHGNDDRFTPDSLFTSAEAGSDSFVGDWYSLILTAAKCECMYLLQPFARRLVDALGRPRPRRRRQLLMLASIYFKLGRQAHYEEVVTLRILGTPRPEKGTEDPERDLDRTTRLGLQDMVFDQRDKLMERLLSPVFNRFGRFHEPSRKNRGILCPVGGDTQACQDRMHGALRRELQRVGLPQVMSPVNLRFSPRFLHERLSQVNTVPETERATAHAKCGLDYAEKFVKRHNLEPGVVRVTDKLFRYQASAGEKKVMAIMADKMKPWAYRPHEPAAWESLYGQHLEVSLSMDPLEEYGLYPSFFFRYADIPDSPMYQFDRYGGITEERNLRFEASWRMRIGSKYSEDCLFSGSEIEALLARLASEREQVVLAWAARRNGSQTPVRLTDQTSGHGFTLACL